LRFSLSMTNFYASHLYTDTISNGSQIGGIFCFAFSGYSGCHHAPYTKQFSQSLLPGGGTSVAQAPWFEESPRKPCLLLFNNVIIIWYDVIIFPQLLLLVGVDISSQTMVWKPCLILLSNIWHNFAREKMFPQLLPRCSKKVAQRPRFRSHVWFFWIIWYETVLLYVSLVVGYLLKWQMYFWLENMVWAGIANQWCKVMHPWRMHDAKCITSCSEQRLTVWNVWAMLFSRILCWKNTRVCNKTF